MKIFVRNAAWLLVEKITRLGVAFVLLGLIARHLGPEDFGVLSLAMSVVAILWAAAGLGLDQLLLKEFAQDTYSDEQLLSTASLLRLLASALLLAPCLVYVTLFGELTWDQRCAFAITLLSLLFYNCTTWQTYWQAKSRAFQVAKVGLITLALSSGIKIFCLVQGYGVQAFAWAIGADLAINLVLFMYWRAPQGLRFRWRHVRWAMLGQLWPTAWPMLVSSLLIVVYTRIDQVMIASMMGVGASGVFSVAVRIVESYGVVPMLIATAFYPMLCRQPDPRTARQYFDIIFFSAWTGALLVWLLAQLAVPWLFGPAYVQVLDILSISLLGAMFSVVGVACTHYLVVIDLGYLRPMRLLGGLLLNVLLNLWLIPAQGLLGAALATLVSQVFASWLGNLLNHKTRPCFKLQAMALLTLGLPGVLALCRKLFGKGSLAALP